MSPRNVVVIIGTGGMGLAIARRLGSGAHLVLADFSQAQLDNAAEILRGEGQTVHAIQTDVSNLESVQNLAKQASQLGTIRAIAHTAGLSPVQAPLDKIYQVDLLGTVHVVDTFLTVASTDTSVVVIASLAGHQAQGTLSAELEKHLATAPADKLLDHPELAPPPDLQENAPGLRAYGISKRANIIRVQASAAAWGKKGARINSVSPGIISTAMGHQEFNGPLKEQLHGLVENSPAARVGTPSDVANVAAFLCSPEASFITGEDVLLDGGWASSRKWID
jgi:NAD(P)-dependent dehydrogenase (short-subunit alcohol dehydrogenase family)